MGACLSGSKAKGDETEADHKPAEPVVDEPHEPEPAEPESQPVRPVGGPQPAVLVSKEGGSTSSSASLKVYIVYYSTYGHVETLVRTFAETLSAHGATCKCWQVPETLPEAVLEKMEAPQKPKDHAIISPSQLIEADALVFGFPTRFGGMCAQMKQFFDATGSLWQDGSLAGKPCTLLTSTASQGGGQETTLLTAATQLTHHGMIYVPPGYADPSLMMPNDAPRGGSAYGAGTLAGADGSRKPSSLELDITRKQAEYFAAKAAKLAA